MITKEILDEAARIVVLVDDCSATSAEERALYDILLNNAEAFIGAVRERDTMRTLLREMEYEGGCDDLCPSCSSVKTPPWSTTKKPHRPGCLLKHFIGEDDD